MNRKIKFLIGMSVLLVLVSAGWFFSARLNITASTPGTGSIMGRVYFGNSLKNIANAKITVQASGSSTVLRQVTSALDGTFKIDSLPVGNYEFISIINDQAAREENTLSTLKVLGSVYDQKTSTISFIFSPSKIYAGFWSWTVTGRTTSQIQDLLSSSNLLFLTALETNLGNLTSAASLAKAQNKKYILYLSLSNTKQNGVCPPVDMTVSTKRMDAVSSWLKANPSLSANVLAIEPVSEPYCYTQAELDSIVTLAKQKFGTIPIMITFIAEQNSPINKEAIHVPSSNLDVIAIDPYVYPSSKTAVTSPQYEDQIKLRIQTEVGWARKYAKPIFLIPQAFAAVMQQNYSDTCMPMLSENYFYWIANYVNSNHDIRAVLWFTDLDTGNNDNYYFCGPVRLRGSVNYPNIFKIEKTLNSQWMGIANP